MPVSAGKAALAAAVVAVMYAAGGAWRTAAAITTLAVLIAPGPDGKSVLGGTLDTLSGYLRGN